VIEAIIAAYGTHPDFTYVDRMGDTQSLFDSDLLVCDWSSTSIEYALGLEKPVLYIDVPPRVRNEHYMDLGIEPIEVSVRNEVGEILSPDELDRAPDLINRLLNDPMRFRKRIEIFRKKVLYNIGSSVEVGATEILQIAEEIKQKRHN
jgi:YidC/Oxa1 family membrane protein insertase